MKEAASASTSYGSAERGAAAPKSMLASLAPFVAEFLGTLVVTFTVGCCALSPGMPTWSPTAIASALMVMVYSTAPISGGHLNPAVSFSLGVVQAVPWRTVIKYWVVQVAGGVAAGICCRALFSPRSAAVEPIAPFTWGYGMLAEVIYTFMLCFVVNNCAASKRNNPKEDGNQFFALAIGFVIVAGGYAVGNVSGACFNPAVTAGLASTGSGYRWVFAWVGAEFLGALLAAIAYRILRWEEYSLREADLEDFSQKLRLRCVSEFLGTLMLVLTVGLNVTIASPAVAFAAGSCLMCMVYSLGDISGAHFNPAVTLAVVMSGRDKCTPSDGAAYVMAQLLGGSAAGLLYASFHAAGPNALVTYGLAPGAGYGPAAAGVAELFFTFVLAYVVLSCATISPPTAMATKRNFFFALAIGSSVTAGGFAIGAISGGELNPAVSLGIATANVKHRGSAPSPPFINCLTFSMWELAGGLLASVAFRLTHPDEYKKAALPLPHPK